MTKSQKFITIEGIDGCGKSTQARLLAEMLAVCFGARNVVHTFEPGGAGKEFREILLSSSLCHKSELLLFLADRLEHVRKIILPSLEQSKWVICERYTDSTLAYQSYGRDIPKNEIENFFAWCEFPVPSLTFLLDISVENAAARVASRGGSKDNFESAGIAFMRKLKDGYEELAAENSRIVKIDASPRTEKVFAEVWRVVEKKFEL